jgi:hypothetical protein
MTDSNRLRISAIREATLGVTPATPRMRVGRITGESLAYAPSFTDSAEIRSDRMSSDPIPTGQSNAGGISTELFFPRGRSFNAELFASAFVRDWMRQPEWDNGEVPASIGAITATTIAVVDQSGTGGFSGAAIRAGALIRMSGMAQPANNAVFRVAANATATSITIAGGAAETAPATGRLKQVGFEGASGAISATVSGLAGAGIDFTTFGLEVGSWIKIGGPAGGAAAFRFANAANNGYARITAITATAITLDNLPAGWAVDAGTGKTIRVFTSDLIRNGTTPIPLTIERSFLGQTTPTHIVQRGMVAGGLRLDFASERVIGAGFDFAGIAGVDSTAALGSAYVDAPTSGAMSANVSVGRVSEAGVAVAGPNWVRGATITLNNNLRMKTALGTLGAVDIGLGECEVAVTLETYFGDNALLQKLANGTPTSINLRAVQNGQAVFFDVPRMVLTGGAPSAGGKNADVILPLTGRASFDAAMQAHLLMSRMEYVEA